MKSYKVGDTVYQFPDELDDNKVQSILMQQGIIRPDVPNPPRPYALASPKEQESRYLNPMSAPKGDIIPYKGTGSDGASDILEGVSKVANNERTVEDRTGGALQAIGGVLSQLAPFTGGRTTSTNLGRVGEVSKDPTVRDLAAKAVPKGEQGRNFIRAVGDKWRNIKGEELAAKQRSAPPKPPMQAPPTNVPQPQPQDYPPPGSVPSMGSTPSGNVPGPAPITPPQPRPVLQASPTNTPQPVNPQYPPPGSVPPTPISPRAQPPVPPQRPPLQGTPTITPQPQPPQGFIGPMPRPNLPTGRVPGGIQNMTSPVLNTGQPIPTPSTAPPPSSVPGTPSTTASTPVLNTAADALRESLAPGSTPGKVATIPGSDTTAIGNAIHDANSTLKIMREQGFDPSKLSDTEKAEAARMISKSDKILPQAVPIVLDKLGLTPKEITPLDTNVPGGPLKEFAKGGVVLPAKEAPAEMARSGEDVKGDMGRSGIDIIRGSFDVPLSSKGKEQAEELAKRFKAKGGLDSIEVSNLHRAVQTAESISKATDTPISNKVKDLRPWALGSIEGQPTLKVLDKIHRYITKQPNVKVPGMGEKSTSPGESFVDFKRRTLGGLKKRLQILKSNPSKRIGLVTHYRDLRLAQSWANKGFPDSMEINSKMMTEKGDDPPTSVHRIYWLGSKPKMEKADMKSNSKLPGGLYLIRHGATALNGTDAKGTPI